jgi:hypothetical protein
MARLVWVPVRGSIGGGVPMARIKPFHTSKSAIYHDQSECAVAKRIAEDQRVAGTLGRRHCSRCETLEQPMTSFLAPEAARPRTAT